MGSTENGSQSKITRQRSLFESTGREIPESEKGERGLSANSKVPFQTEPTLAEVTDAPGSKSVAAPTEYVEPIWIQRMKLIISVTFSVWVGLWLVVLPWTPVWDHNGLLFPHPDLRTLFQHFFTRGAVSGLGFIDVWIGIWTAVNYHDKK